ncbi:MAG TPA: hypothetical protein VF635_05105 [Propionibacteriaceae bacterium]
MSIGVAPQENGQHEHRGPQASAGPQHRQLLRRAAQVWRAAGVRAVDRRALAKELAAELTAAEEDGRDVRDVVGDEPEVTLRQWAVERGVAGRALRLGLLGSLTLASIGLGAAVIIVDQVVQTVVPGAPFITHWGIWLAALVSGALSSLVLASLSCWAALHRGGDPRAGATARWLLVTLPLGALVALALSVITAAVSGYAHAAIPVIGLVITATFVANAAAARLLAVRFTRAES